VNIIIFDFDGTIADTFDAVLNITNSLAKELGHKPPSPEDVKRLRNLDSREIIKQSGIPLFRLPFLLRRIKSELRREIAQLQPIDGMKDALKSLKRRGDRLGIVTSNSEENVALFLETHGLGELFDFTYSGTTLFGKARVINHILRKYGLSSDTVIYVGDETRDIEAAKRIGIQVIAVSWGFNAEQALARQKPDFLIHSPSQLVNVVHPAY
jgi:phosphoglycolate phosphatase